MSVDAIVLFSGGLDSILAAKVLEEQGLEVLCLHCISPFFGSRHSIDRWKKIYSLNIVSLDVGREFMQMLCRRPMVSARFSIPVWTAKFCFSPRPKNIWIK